MICQIELELELVNLLWPQLCIRCADRFLIIPPHADRVRKNSALHPSAGSTAIDGAEIEVGGYDEFGESPER
jgi:hypothetical protein